MTEIDTRERVTILSQKDLEISYFCGSGAGGQARNKVASGVLIRHEESGATGRASDSRSQYQNKLNAFKRLLTDPRMRFWLARKVHEIRLGETLDEQIAKETEPQHLKYEIKNAAGQWEEVNADYFDSPDAKQEHD